MSIKDTWNEKERIACEMGKISGIEQEREDASIEWLNCDEATLRQFHLGAGECAAEAESNEGRQGFYRQAKAINAIGAFRFPETWGDGLPPTTSEEFGPRYAQGDGAWRESYYD